MKSVVLFTVTLIVSIFFTSMKSNAYADLDSICLYIAEDDKTRLRKALRSNHVKIRKLFNEITCNEMSLLQFAIKRKSKTVGVFMVKKIPVSALNKSNILQWVEDEGHQETDIAVAIMARING